MRNKTENGENVTLEKLLDDIRAAVRDGEELLKAGASGMKETAVAKARSADRIIRDRPYETIGIIFGVGLIIGLLMSGAFASGREGEE